MKDYLATVRYPNTKSNKQYQSINPFNNDVEAMRELKEAYGDRLISVYVCIYEKVQA